MIRRRRLGRTPAPTPPQSLDPYELDFTGAAQENPLSAGGIWTNDTQGTGGNVAMNAQSSMRVIESAASGFNIAAGDATGQSDPFDYMDSFAFVPGFPGNQRITAVMYADPTYVPGEGSGHELELLLGCSSAAGSRRWISCTWDRNGTRIMALMNGPANGYSILSPEDAGAVGLLLADTNVWVAELYREENTVITYRNGVQIQSLTSGAISSLGHGIGIGSFRRTLTGGSAANRYGFRSVRCEGFT